MNSNSVKINFKIGQLEVRYEGRDSFLKDELSNFLEKILDLVKRDNTLLANSYHQSSGKVEDLKEENTLNLSTATIASRINENNGPGLAMAAAAHLTFVEKKDSFSRKEILEEMKTASNYYKAPMGSNLGANLNRLVKKGRLNQTASGTYALASTEKEKLKNAIVE